LLLPGRLFVIFILLKDITPNSREHGFSFQRIWQDRAGILLSIFWLSNYKESTQRKGNNAAMQDFGALGGT
jgi:hypothetical protein